LIIYGEKINAPKTRAKIQHYFNWFYYNKYIIYFCIFVLAGVSYNLSSKTLSSLSMHEYSARHYTETNNQHSFVKETGKPPVLTTSMCVCVMHSVKPSLLVGIHLPGTKKKTTLNSFTNILANRFSNVFTRHTTRRNICSY
jgi:hypothetical protein